MYDAEQLHYIDAILEGHGLLAACPGSNSTVAYGCENLKVPELGLADQIKIQHLQLRMAASERENLKVPELGLAVSGRSDKTSI